MPPPEWSRVQVESRAQNTGVPSSPLGDATRWGGSVTQPLPGFGVPQVSAQFIRAQALDHYSRLWSAIGNVVATTALFATPNGLVPGGWNHWLEVVQGTGQMRITQQFDLRKLTTIGAVVYNAISPDPGVLVENRSFAIIGGILGNTIEMRVISTNFSGIAESVQTSVLLSAFAAGTGL